MSLLKLHHRKQKINHIIISINNIIDHKLNEIVLGVDIVLNLIISDMLVINIPWNASICNLIYAPINSLFNPH